MLTKLLRPFAYLTIRHPTNLPLWVNWWVPIIASCMVVAVVGLVAKTTVDVWGASGVISRFLGFVQNLPGFYIAALAAIATFNSESMQKIMPGTPPTMDIPHNGAIMVQMKLTRRLFLSSMFAYLTALSLLLTIAAISGLAVADSVKATLPVYLYPWLKSAATMIYLMLAAQLLTVTFWGLYYLGERLHLADT